MIPGISGGTLSGGAGGVDLSAGPSSAESGSDVNTGGAVFNFAPSQGVQKAKAWAGLAPWAVIALVVLWLFLRK